MSCLSCVCPPSAGGLRLQGRGVLPVVGLLEARGQEGR